MKASVAQTLDEEFKQETPSNIIADAALAKTLTEQLAASKALTGDHVLVWTGTINGAKHHHVEVWRSGSLVHAFGMNNSGHLVSFEHKISSGPATSRSLLSRMKQFLYGPQAQRYAITDIPTNATKPFTFTRHGTVGAVPKTNKNAIIPPSTPAPSPQKQDKAVKADATRRSHSRLLEPCSWFNGMLCDNRRPTK